MRYSDGSVQPVRSRSTPTAGVVALLAVLVLAAALLVTTARTAQAQSYVQVTVQTGDTLSKIAARYCTSWEMIYNINGAIIGPNPSNLNVGIVLTVPNNCGTAGSADGIWDRGARVNATGQYVAPWYTAAWGDTLDSIAQRFGTTVMALVRDNNLPSLSVAPGLLLYIGGSGAPTPTPAPSLPEAERVRFDAYAISASRNGLITGSAAKRYVLAASSGQNMTIFSQSYGAPLVLSVEGPDGQLIRLNGSNGQLSNSVMAGLPAKGDYIITVAPLPDGLERVRFDYNITFVIQ